MTSNLIHTKYSLLDFLAGFLDNSTQEYGASVLVLRHDDPGKVWLLSFDVKRYDLYRQLGIDVGVRYERQFRWVDGDQLRFTEYDVFECEKLSDGYLASSDVKERYKLLSAYVRESDLVDAFYDGAIPFPLPYPELQNILWFALDHATDWDWGLSNILVRDDGTIFLSDVLHGEDDFAPTDIMFDPTQFLWIERLTKEVSCVSTNG